MNPELNNDIYDLIIRKLEGSATHEEESSLTQWLSEHTENQEAYDSITALWESAAIASVFENLDLDSDWRSTEKALKRENKPALKSSNRLRPVRLISGIAAGLALILLSYFAYLNLNPEKGIREIALSDGSKVWLNQNAAFDYPKTFTGNKRTVTLKGEAFFDIAKNPTIPFVINTSESRITVLGTSFNVDASSEKTEVIVATGKVELSDRDDPNNQIALIVGEKGTHTANNVSSQPNNRPNYLAWKTGIFTFEGTPVAEAIDELSSVAEKPVRLASGITSDCLLRAIFEKEKIPAILETIALSCGLRLKEFENAYVLSAVEE